MSKVKYTNKNIYFFKPLIYLIVILSSYKFITIINMIKEDHIFNPLLIVHMVLILLSFIYLNNPDIFNIKNRKKHKEFLSKAKKINGKILKVHQKKFNGLNIRNFEFEYTSTITKKSIKLFSKQLAYEYSQLDDNTFVDCEVYEVKLDDLSYNMESSIFTPYTIYKEKKGNKILVYVDKVNIPITLFDRMDFDAYFTGVTLLIVILTSIII